ncbi:MAG TPA: BrnA antitoxin family protein, partial [Thermomicrobiales bacterium]|nr:BrnA antitoxin family protein [Thermomicrobiales bacterium]
MQNDDSVVRYTADEIDDLARRGQDQTDFERVRAMTDDDLEASIDLHEEGECDWSTVQIGVPAPKRQLTVRFDGDLIDWFKAQGPGYQTRMNAVLR